MGLIGFLDSAGLVLWWFAEVGALGCWSLVVLAVGGAMIDGMFLEAVGGKSCEYGKGEMVRGNWLAEYEDGEAMGGKIAPSYILTRPAIPRCWSKPFPMRLQRKDAHTHLSECPSREIIALSSSNPIPAPR